MYVGEAVGLYGYTATAEAERGASIMGVRFTLDTNGNGTLGAGDLVLGDGVNDESNRWHLFAVVNADWVDAEVNGVVTIFAATGPAPPRRC